jgi:hypothetical protein
MMRLCCLSLRGADDPSLRRRAWSLRWWRAFLILWTDSLVVRSPITAIPLIGVAGKRWVTACAAGRSAR